MLLPIALLIRLHIHRHAPHLLPLRSLSPCLQLLAFDHAKALVPTPTCSTMHVVYSFTIIYVFNFNALESGLLWCYEKLAFEVVFLLW